VAASVREGEILAGKYRVDRVLGSGGMGIVVAAHHLELDDRVAIKFLLPEARESVEAVERFAREARAAVKIKSEHVARVADVGRLPDGAPFIVMEYLEGSDLGAWLSERGPLPVEQAVDFILQASEAIAEAHALGIVHRDLKPGNLFVTRRPDGGLSIKVLDFGISKMTGLASSAPLSSMTQTSTMMGSPQYMPPEQIRSSKDVDARSDIWALGVILYELLTGHPPFDGENLAELVYRIISTSAPPVRDHRPELSPVIETVIAKCLAKERDERFASIAELACALLPFAPRRSLSSLERISGVTIGRYSDADSLLGAWQEQNGPSRGAETKASWVSTGVAKSRGTWLLFGSTGVLAIALVVVLATRPAPSTPAAALPSPVPTLAELAPSTRVAPAPASTAPESGADTPTFPSTSLTASPPPTPATSSRPKPKAPLRAPAAKKPNPSAADPGGLDPWRPSRR